LEVLALRPLAAPATAPLRIAVFEEDGLQPVAQSCRDAVRRAAEALREAGHEVVEAAPPEPEAARRVFDTMLFNELAAFAGPELDGVEDLLSRYGRGVAAAMRGFTPELLPYLEAAREHAPLQEGAAPPFPEHPIA